MKTKRIEVVLHPLEMEQQFPIGKEIIVGGKRYKVLGGYQDAKQSISFASFPSFLAEEVNRNEETVSSSSNLRRHLPSEH